MLQDVSRMSATSSTASRDSFFSCIGDDEEHEIADCIGAHRPSVRANVVSTAIEGKRKSRAKNRKLVPSQNGNKVSHYRWLQSLLDSILGNTAYERATTMDTREKATPIFVLAGGCPNAFCPMQAVV